MAVAALMGAQLISGAQGAASAITAGEGAADALETNVALNRLQADREIRRGQVAAEQRGILTGQQAGAARVSAAAGGTLVGTGSNIQIETDIKLIGELDQAQIGFNAWASSFNFQVRAQDQRFQARRVRAGARVAAANSILTSTIKATGTFLEFRGSGDGDKPKPTESAPAPTKSQFEKFSFGLGRPPLLSKR